MNWSSRPAVIAVSCAALGVIAAGTLTAVAYAGSPDRGNDTIHGCVSTRTGMLRVVDAQRGGRCVTRGPLKEYAITLSQAAGLPGPRGPRGPAGDGIDSLDALEGLPCNVGTEDEGEVVIRIGPPERGSVVQMICETDDTVTYTPTSPPPTTPPRPTTTEPMPTTPLLPALPPGGVGDPDPPADAPGA